MVGPTAQNLRGCSLYPSLTGRCIPRVAVVNTSLMVQGCTSPRLTIEGLVVAGRARSCERVCHVERMTVPEAARLMREWIQEAL